jgi:hypothetical protein
LRFFFEVRFDHPHPERLPVVLSGGTAARLCTQFSRALTKSESSAGIVGQDFLHHHGDRM